MFRAECRVDPDADVTSQSVHLLRSSRAPQIAIVLRVRLLADHYALVIRA
jgi:hypothetical protein